MVNEFLGTVVNFIGDPWQIGTVDGTGAHAQLFMPRGMALSTDNTLYFVDNQKRIRETNLFGSTETLPYAV